MKKIAIIPAILICFIISAFADVKYDHSYSVNNYKHRNKAELARRLNLDNLAIHAYAFAQDQWFDNYKNNFATTESHGGFVPGAAIDFNTGLASANNYKMQNKSKRNEDTNIEQPERGPVVLNMK